MATPTADMSESYLHVSRDNTDKLSSGDEFTATLDDLLQYLQMAKQHDLQTARTRVDAPKRLGSPVISSHSTPLSRKANGDLPGNSGFHPGSLPDLDGAALFQALRPFLEQYMGTKRDPEAGIRADNINHDVFVTPLRETEDLDTDHLKEMDDTFDKVVRRSISQKNQSPLTTPPLSSGDSQLSEFERHAVEDDMCKPIRMPPRVELADLTTDEIDIGPYALPKGTAKEKDDLAELRLELERYKQDNLELVNELKYVKGLVERKDAGRDIQKEKTAMKDTKPAEVKETRSATPMEEISNRFRKLRVSEEKDINEDSIPESFRPYYQRLQIGKVDELSDAAKANLIKNIMLSLLVADFDHLPTMAPKIGVWISMTSRFLDDIHARFYACSDMRPLRYLHDHEVDVDGLQECLDGMLSRI